jgi:hypothetical protein
LRTLYSLLAPSLVYGFVFLGSVLPAAADWLVTQLGDRIETRGAWRVEKKSVIFTLPNGTLSSLRVSDVDLAASEKATAAASEARPAGATGMQSFAVPGHGELRVVLPEGWTTVEVRRPPGDLPTFVFRPVANAGIKLLVSVIAPRADSNLTAPALKSLITSAANHLLPTSVEQSLTLQELRVPSGLGYRFSLTDRAPKPGEYKYMTQGMVPIGRLALTFTLLSKSPTGLQEMLALITSAELDRK